MPNRVLYYPNIAKGVHRDKRKRMFSSKAMPNLILYIRKIWQTDATRVDENRHQGHAKPCGQTARFRYGKMKTDFHCVKSTWEQRKNMSDIIRNMSDIF